MTDMVAKPVSLKNMLSDRFDIDNYLSAQEISNLNLMAEDIEVHAGMAEAAIYIFQQVCNKQFCNLLVFTSQQFME